MRIQLFLLYNSGLKHTWLWQFYQVKHPRTESPITKYTEDPLYKSVNNKVLQN